jgi:hypothetical protein
MSNLFGLLGGMSIWALAAAAALRQHPLYLPVLQYLEELQRLTRVG